MSDFFGGAPDTAALRAHLYRLKREYGTRFKVFPIGRSALGRDILVAGVGEIRGATLIVGGIGGQDWGTTLLLTRFLGELVACMKDGSQLAGIDVRRAMVGRSLMVAPCLNPDGIELAARGAAGAGSMSAAVERLSGGNYDGWQANARGVDLRRAFDAGWSPCGAPSGSGYGGRVPMSEPECRAIANLCSTFSMKRLLVVSQGAREICYRFAEPSPRSRLMAQVLAGSCGGRVSDRPGAAGLKDWFIHRFGRPAFELGVEEAPDDGALPQGVAETLLLAMLL